MEDKVVLLVKGVAYLEGDAFTVDRENNTITWMATEINGGFDITSDWIHKIIVKYKEYYDSLIDPECVGRFKGDKKLIEAPWLRTENITDMNEMFFGCTSLIKVPKYNTSQTIKMGSMFINCKALATIPQLDTFKVSTMDRMFYGCISLTTIPQLDTSKVTTMMDMFGECTVLTTLPQLDTSNVTDMMFMFRDCKALTTLPQLDTSNCNDNESYVLKLYSIKYDSAIEYFKCDANNGNV